MKKTVLALLALFLFAGSLSAGEKKTLKVLVIGNSFSHCLLIHLPKMVRAEGKYDLILASLYIGGCSLERHVKELEKAQKDPEHRSYVTNYGTRQKVNLPDVIGEEKWDVVTIQQASGSSWKKESYQPHADKLIAYIRSKAPQAEIVIQETWAYRADDKRIAAWNLTQQSMHEKLKKCYFDLAAEKNFRVIPMGEAVQFYRKGAPFPYKAPSAAELKALKEPALPGTTEADPVGRSLWRVPKGKKGAKVLFTDSKHLNGWGHYMQACVWYGFLFGDNPESIKYQPKFPYPWMAPLCRKAAAQALDSVRDLNRKNFSAAGK